ncbi:MAG TPA: putative baseplate assembly protein [Polyangium sp.]|nr:putative baseplate assembly protein [Polyangium sp.]
MPRSSPPLLNSNYDEVATRVEKLAVAATNVPGSSRWTPPADGSMDLGRALIRVFDTMARHASERINRIPERNFLAFLERLGITPSASRPARVPLTFSLVAGGNSESTVPGRTRVGAMPQSGDTREVVFETERDLFTTRAKVAAVVVRQPDGDRLVDRTAEGTGAREAFFSAFDAGDPATHGFYLAADDVLNVPSGTNVTMTFVVDDASRWTSLFASPTPALTTDAYYRTAVPAPPLVRWSYWNGTSWTPLTLTSTTGTAIGFRVPADMASAVVNGRRARWIRAQLLAWPLAGVPRISGVTISSTPSQTGVVPTAAFANSRPLDLTVDFYPFGEAPRFNDYLLIACEGLLDKRSASVTITIALNASTRNLKTADAPLLTWEISTATGWRAVASLVAATGTVLDPAIIRNDVLRTQTFVVPAEAAPMTIGNIRTVWLRVRLAGGSFGRGLNIDYSVSPPRTTDDGYRPPIVQTLTVSSSATLTNSNPLCTTEDDFTFQDRAFQAPVSMFTRAQDTQPTLYIGFDRPLAARETRLYFQIAPLDPIAAARDTSAAAQGTIIWEYWARSNAWLPLVFDDETRNFAASGMLQFVAPADSSRRMQFSRDLYWFRGRYQLPTGITAPPPVPRLGRVLTNTVWAVDATARQNEVIGSSDGRASAIFKVVGRPVIEGQILEVRESSLPRDVAISLIVSEADARYAGQVWVRWQEVDNFYSSGANDRHYTIDREQGIITFGDGRRGMAPPRGVQNIRVSYTSGGGLIGNRAAGTVKQLKTTVPYVDGVTNHESAQGGADADTGEEIKTWGPSVLRHGYKAVTAQDFEDLALEASPAVARAKAITVDFDSVLAAENPGGAITGVVAPGTLVLLLATNGAELPPAASGGILRDVDAYLRARSSPAVDLRLAGPTWVEVSVTSLDITAVSMQGAEALRHRIQRTLTAFFHPITGNVDNEGWAFGALPNESDVYRLVTSIPGVSRIGALNWTLRTIDGQSPPAFEDPLRNRVLIYPGTQNVRIVATGGA